MCISTFDTAGSYSVQVVSQGPVYWLQVPLVGLVFKNHQPILTSLRADEIKLWLEFSYRLHAGQFLLAPKMSSSGLQRTLP